MRPRKSQRELPACVYLRHGAFWFVKRGKWTRLGSELREALSEYARPTSTDGGGLGKWVAEALRAHSHQISPSTLKQYEQAARRFEAAFVEFAPEQVRQKHVAAWRRSMADTPTMANRCLSVARIV